MEAMKQLVGKPLIEYPTEWEYRIVGQDPAAIREVVLVLVGDRAHKLVEARRSRQGRWVSMSLVLVVRSEEDRTSIYEALVADPAVRLVM